MCVVGVDGGATSARAVVLDPDGRQIGRSVGPGVIASRRDPASAVSAVASVVKMAVRAANLEPPVAALWAGLAGAGRESVRASVEERLRGECLADEVAVGTDLDAALLAALGVGPGIILVAGTGSVAVGRSEQGTEARVGGWGERLGDEGSGFWIGLEGLRRVAGAVDGRSEDTELRRGVVEALGLSGPTNLIGWLELSSKAEVAALAPLVLDIADSGDAVAGGIVEDAARALAKHVSVAYERAGPWMHVPRLGLVGGLVGGSGRLRSRVLDALEGLELDLLDADLDPAAGAARKALDLLRRRTT